MNHVITPHSKLLGVIEPVLNDMPAGTLRHALFRAFWDETASLLDIEDAFARVTARRQAVEPLRKFFASWSKTNNSAASVSGLANRLTLLARSEQGSAAADQLYRACGSLQRITTKTSAPSATPCMPIFSTPWPPPFAATTAGCCARTACLRRRRSRTGPTASACVSAT